MDYKKHENTEDGEIKKSNKYVHSWKNIWIYVQCYFVTIASILGTGILGLPVTAGESGFTPFLVSFLLGYVMQALGLLFFVDLLQKAQSYLLNSSQKDLEAVPLNELHSEDDDDEKEDENGEQAADGVNRKIRRYEESDNVINLHSMCILYLPHYLWIPFDASVFFLLMAAIIGFSLAGSEAFAQLFRIENYVNVIPFYIWLLALSIVFLGDLIKVTISVMTLFKGGVLVAVVIATTGVGAEVGNPITNDFSKIGSSFLMGTVALGGVINILPILYSKVEPVKEQVRCFFLASFSALTTCMVLNVLWVLAVLRIVPQTDSECSPMYSVVVNETTQHPLPTILSSCSNYSLERSKEIGEIATVPLTSIILEDFPEFSWIGESIQIFIAVSVTVSYLTYGTAMKHMLGGVLEATIGKKTSSDNEAINKLHRVTQLRVFQPVVFLMIYAIICVVCMTNPTGFVNILEFFSSALLNIELGLFVFLMIQGSRKEKYRNINTPWKLPEMLYYLQYVMAAFFIFAVGFAIVEAISIL
ncbi:uncharacterized protein [Antedon mediterranea]|uniref:uncharacterized protein n=1 Tax=Antedon mediterranea TaxID=105859 RepID=UPI003AF5D104